MGRLYPSVPSPRPRRLLRVRIRAPTTAVSSAATPTRAFTTRLASCTVRVHAVQCILDLIDISSEVDPFLPWVEKRRPEETVYVRENYI